MIAVIPVKPFDFAKSRLAAALSADVRTDLARRLFLRTLSVVASCDRVTKIEVITADKEAERLALSRGCNVIREVFARGLNPALKDGFSKIQADDDTGILILPTDLPHISPDDIAELACGNGPAIAPDAHGTGTNGLYFTRRDKPEFHFGENSAAKHQDAFAEMISSPLRIVRRSGLSFDLDTPEDLRRFGHPPNNTEIASLFRNVAQAA